MPSLSGEEKRHLIGSMTLFAGLSDEDLDEWIESGLITLEQGDVVIHRPRELERLAGVVIA